MKQSEWKDIPGYENSYQCNTLGQIKSLPKFKVNKYGTIATGKDRILKQYKDKDGYLFVGLYKDGAKTPKCIKSHRLIAMTFLEGDSNGLQVNHKNGVRDDNKVENLEWVTCQENIIHSYKVLGKQNSNIGIEVECRWIASDGTLYSEVFQSYVEAASKMQISRNSIQRAIEEGITVKGIWFGLIKEKSECLL